MVRALNLEISKETLSKAGHDEVEDKGERSLDIGILWAITKFKNFFLSLRNNHSMCKLVSLGALGLTANSLIVLIHKLEVVKSQVPYVIL